MRFLQIRLKKGVWTGILLLFSCQLMAQDNALLSARPLNPLASKIISLVNFVKSNGKTIERLQENDLTSLPVGLVKNIGGKEYVIAIDSAYQTGQGWFFSAYTSLTLPGATRPVAFRAINIAFGPGGISGSSAIRLKLVSDEYINLGDYVELEIPGNGSNYVEFDCNGFKSINLSGNFLFSPQLIEPDPTINAPRHPSGRVSAAFQVNAASLNDILLSVSISPFRLKGIKDFAFSVQKAIVDMSDYANPPGFAFPPDYQQSYGDNLNLWRGFFLQELTVKYNFTDSTGRSSPTFDARNVLIDDLGVSGMFTASNLFTLEQASASGWAVSVNRLSVKLLRNHLTGASLSGALNVPFLGADTLSYAAAMEEVLGEVSYRFLVTTNATRDFNSPLGTVYIDKGSSISLEKYRGRLRASALLNGRLSVKQNIFSVSNIGFERLQLSSSKPYLIGGIFSLEGNGSAQAAGFPVSLDKIQLGVSQGKAVLGFQAGLNIMNPGDKSPSIRAFIQLTAQVETTTRVNGEWVDTLQHWAFKGVQINDILIDINTTSFGITGRLSVYDKDLVYGNGFRGGVKLKLKTPDLEIGANAYFGGVNGMRYWHVDAFANFGEGIPILPPLNLSGIMGGMSYHMSRQGAFKPDFAAIGSGSVQADASKTLGKILVYVPDSTVSLAFLAGVSLNLGKKELCTADALLEIAFREGGGVRYVSFDGGAYFFVPPGEGAKGTEPNGQTPVVAKLKMNYDADSRIFFANLQAYINIGSTVRGIGPKGLAGEMVIYVSPSDWYVYIGRPKQRLGITIADIFRSEAYFMVGTKLEPLAPPPAKVLEILGANPSVRSQNEEALATGRGFGFGTRLEAGGSFEVTPFYASFFAGGGFDVMLINYGNTAYCKGSTPPLGANGWYAQGQAYIYLEGKVGIAVKRRRFDIVSLGLAALLQAKGPNPTWLQGRATGNFRILGGLVKGNFNVKFQFGQQCELVTSGSELNDVPVIGDLKPAAGTKEISVFTAPQVAFNIPVGELLSMENNQGETHAYQVVLDEFVLSKNDNPLQAILTWNAKKDALVLKTPEVLPPVSDLKIKVKIHWQKKQANGIWEDLKKMDGTLDVETKELTFTTGTAPDNIDEQNIAFAYPVKNQYNFHKGETGTGYLDLKWGQSYLFQPQGEIAYRFKVRFQEVGGKAEDVTLDFSNPKRLTFNIPLSLRPEAVFKMSILRIPDVRGSAEENVQRQERTISSGDSSQVSLASATLSQNLVQAVEKELYGTAFRTSRFATFVEKINSLSSENDLFIPNQNNTLTLAQRANTDETFDAFELNGDEENRLVQGFVGEDNPWYRQKIYPNLYEPILKNNILLKNRKPELMGVPPLKAVSLFSNETREGYRLEESEVSTGIATRRSGTITAEYYFSFYAYNDYHDLQDQIANQVVSGNNNLINYLKSNSYPGLEPGRYPVILKYILPGTKQSNHETTIYIRY